MRKMLVIICIIFMILTACNGIKKEGNVENVSKLTQPEEVELVLIGIDSAFESLFTGNFRLVEKAHKDMIFRETDKTKELFRSNRPDLNGKLVYDANRNTAVYVFNIKPQKEDLTVINEHLIVIEPSSYLYIQNGLLSYFSTIKQELAKQQIPFEIPKLEYKFQKSDKEYLYVSFIPFNPGEVLMHIKSAENPDEIKVNGSFASGLVKIAFENPFKTVRGSSANENAILGFFEADYETIANGRSVNNEVSEIVEETETNADSQKEITNLNPGETVNNQEYGFSLTIPSHWPAINQVKENREDEVWFNFSRTYKEMEIPIFAIKLLKKSLVSRDYFEGGMDIYIGENDIHYFAYTLPGEAPMELMEPENQAELEYSQKMTYEDVPGIIEGFDIY
jgi:hypothetical protein